MRFIVEISIPVEKFNEAIRDGTAGEKARQILDQTKPEACYFHSKNGRRGATMVVDIADAAEMPRLSEPWFLLFDATVEFIPAMLPQDIWRSGLDHIRLQWQ